MIAEQSCYLSVFGVEVGQGAEDEICRRVRKMDGVLEARWHSPSHSLCLRIEQPGAVTGVINELRRLGFVLSAKAVHLRPTAPEALNEPRQTCDLNECDWRAGSQYDIGSIDIGPFGLHKAQEG